MARRPVSATDAGLWGAGAPAGVKWSPRVGESASARAQGAASGEREGVRDTWGEEVIEAMSGMARE
ncbi:MAG: hypothetical protein EB084_08940 [Proteobacteria bacterium]|nr:hypothetical protein [Pseudomonadota bacterium]